MCEHCRKVYIIQIGKKEQKEKYVTIHYFRVNGVARTFLEKKTFILKILDETKTAASVSNDSSAVGRNRGTKRPSMTPEEKKEKNKVKN